jgi:phage I-like protein
LAHGSSAVAFEYGTSKLLCLTELRPIDVKGLVDDPDEPGRSFGWLHVARVGEWKGHPKGPFEFTHELFDEIARNNQRRTTPVNADYEHASRNYDATDAKPSSGEVVKVELRDGGDNLWAFMHWTSRATSMLRAREYRTCSPVIAFKAIDRVTGEDIGADLLSVALTNDPFQDGLQPVQLTWTAAMSDMSPEQKKASELAAKAEKAKAMADAADEFDKQKALAAAPPPAEKTAEELKSEEDAKAADEAKKAKELDANGGDPPATDETAAAPDASAVLMAIADKSGKSADEVIGALMDNLDKVIAIVTGTRDGSISDATPMTARSNEVLTLQLSAQESKVVALSEQVAVLNAAAKKRDDEDKAAATKRAAEAKAVADVALTDKVKALQAGGFVRNGDENLARAKRLFELDPALAAETYAEQIVPLSVDLSGADPRGNASVATVELSGLSAIERDTVSFLMNAGINEKLALQKIAEKRGGKVAVQ